MLYKFRKILCENNEEKILKYLLNLLNKGTNINEIDNEGKTPLMSLIRRSCHYNTYIFVFTKYGADINKVNNKGETPFYLACKYACKSTIESLIQHGSDINKFDNEGNTSLFVLCDKDNYSRVGELIEDLIKQGANINKRNNKGETALFRLCSWASEYTIIIFSKQIYMYIFIGCLFK